MTTYKIMDAIKNGVFLGFLYRVIWLLMAPHPEDASWWFRYHIPFLLLVFGIPFAALCIAQYVIRRSLLSHGKQASAFPLQNRVLFSLLFSVGAVALLSWVLYAFQGPLTTVVYYITRFLLGWPA